MRLGYNRDVTYSCFAVRFYVVLRAAIPKRIFLCRLCGRVEKYMKNTKIYLVRHGESLGNAIHQMLGHTDLDLSPFGYVQAEATAKALADVHFDEIHSSDLLRAYNTALPHARMRGLAVLGNRELREIFLGAWEGKLVSAVMEEYGEDAYVKDWRGGFGTFRFPEGESVREACARFTAEITKISRHAPGKTILLAAHAAVLRSFYASISGIPFEEMAEKTEFPANASYSVVEFDGERFIPIEYSHDDYLADVVRI